jgi:hypothetical protein
VIASIEQPELIDRILAHRREQEGEEAPSVALGARAPPQPSLIRSSGGLERRSASGGRCCALQGASPRSGSVDALKVRCEGIREADAASQSDGAFDTIAITRRWARVAGLHHLVGARRAATRRRRGRAAVCAR